MLNTAIILKHVFNTHTERSYDKSYIRQAEKRNSTKLKEHIKTNN